MVKSNDPNALVLGPEEWGWNGYFYSGYDQQWSGQHDDYNAADYPDRTANGGWDYMPVAVEPVPSVRHAPTTCACWIIYASLLSAGKQRQWKCD